MRNVRVVLLAWCCWAASGCFNPQIQSGDFKCRVPDYPDCPTGFSCQGGVCVSSDGTPSPVASRHDGGASPPDQASSLPPLVDAGRPDLPTLPTPTQTPTPTATPTPMPTATPTPTVWPSAPPDLAQPSPPDLGAAADMSRRRHDLASQCVPAGGDCTYHDDAVCCSSYCDYHSNTCR